MISFCIKNNNPNIIDYLMKNIKNIDLENIIFSKRTFSKYENVILHYVGNDTSSFYHELTNIICDCILKFYEPVIINNIIHSDYFYFDEIDISKIEANCMELLANDNVSVINDSFKHFNYKELKNNFSDRKSFISSAVFKYITNNKSIVLDGFVHFRLSKYFECLNEAIDSAVNQLILDKEYFDFINLVKLYIDSKPPATQLVHLIYVNESSILLDKNKNVININKKPFNLNYLSDISFSENDYVLNSLLSLLPDKIVLHLVTPKDEFINTLILIFGNRIQICNNCEICKIYRLLDIGS